MKSFHIYQLDENNKLKIHVHAKYNDHEFSKSFYFDRKPPQDTCVYGFNFIFDSLILIYGQYYRNKIFKLPWLTPVDFKAKFLGRDGRYITIAHDDVLSSSGLANRVISENMYLFRTLTSQTGTDTIELRYIPIEVTQVAGTGLFKKLRWLRPEKTYQVLLIQKFSDGKLLDEGYQLLHSSVDACINNYISMHGMKEITK